VQTPPAEIGAQTRPAQPLAGEFGKKGTGALAIGDSLLKGFMLGHQQKEQKKAAQAQATINAADASANAAYEQYQQALTKAGGNQNDPSAQAAYQAYQTAFQAGKQAKAQFVIPDKTQKGKKNATDTDPAKSPDDKKKKNPASAGFNNIKDFFDANPHIVPQIALLTMQPKPPGLSPQGQEQVQNLETNRLANEQKQRQLQNEKTYQDGFTTFSHLSPGEIASLPPDVKKGYAAWQNARAALTPMKFSGTAKLYDVGNGKKAYLYPEEAAQYYPNAQPVDTSAAKPGTPGFFLKKKADELGKDVNDLSTQDIEAANGEYRSSLTPSTATTSTSTTNPQGDRTTVTTRSAKPGGYSKPPTAGASPSGQRTQGVGQPPQVGKTAQTAQTGARGGYSQPPKGKETALTASVTRQATKAQQEGYKKAETAHSAALTKADNDYRTAVKQAADDPDALKRAQAARDRAVTRAELDLEDAKAGVAKEYDAAVKSIGGTPGSETTGSLPPGWQ
jgi:hypothetical protein